MLLASKCLALAMLSLLSCLIGLASSQESFYEGNVDPALLEFLQSYYPELFTPDFDLVKRYNSYGFGLGKKSGYSFGLGKRQHDFNFGLGKKSKAYNFGIGKRSTSDTERVNNEQESNNHRRKRETSEDPILYDKKSNRYGFGVGKREVVDEEKLGGNHAYGLSKRNLDYDAFLVPYPEVYQDGETFVPDLYHGSTQESEDKRAKSYSFGLGKRARTGYSFGLGKRTPDAYSFGLGKRSYSFGLGKREPGQFSFGLGKRGRGYGFGLGKRDPGHYGFGLGKREGQPYMQDANSDTLSHYLNMNQYNIPYSGYGRRSYDFGLGKRSSYGFGLGKKRSYSFGLGKRSNDYVNLYEDPLRDEAVS